MGKNRAIGKNNSLLWHIPEELKRFKSITMGHPIIMGRKTYESIGKPLPGRTNIVITRDEDYSSDGVEVVHSLEEALRFASLTQGDDEIFVIGGGQIYQQAINLADKLYLTIVDDNPEADTYFPDYSAFSKIVFESTGEDAGFKFKFLKLER